MNILGDGVVNSGDGSDDYSGIGNGLVISGVDCNNAGDGLSILGVCCDRRPKIKALCAMTTIIKLLSLHLIKIIIKLIF